MSYRIYNETQFLGEVDNKSTGINGLLPATSYQFGVSNYNGVRESPKTTISVKTRGIRLIIPTSLTVNSVITLNYQENVDDENKRDVQAKVISAADGKSTVELLEPLESSSTVSVGGTNLLTKTSNDWKTWTGTYWSNDTVDNGPIDLEPGSYVFRAEIDNTGNNLPIRAEAEIGKDSWLNEFSSSYKEKWVEANSKGYVGITFTIDKRVENISFRSHVGTSTWDTTTTIKYRKEKLEKGTIATPWSSAPVDTQYIIDNTQMNELQDGSFTASNGHRAIYFRQ